MKIETQFGDLPPFPEAAAQGEKTGEQMAKIFAKVFGPSQVLSTTTYTYDQNGLLVERTRQMGLLGGERTTFRYDDHRNPVEESTVHENREYGTDEQGELHVTKERSDAQHIRFEYQYDKRGNWTERVVWSRLDPIPILSAATSSAGKSAITREPRANQPLRRKRKHNCRNQTARTTPWPTAGAVGETGK